MSRDSQTFVLPDERGQYYLSGSLGEGGKERKKKRKLNLNLTKSLDLRCLTSHQPHGDVRLLECGQRYARIRVTPIQDFKYLVRKKGK